jgi:hypothetical protein
MSTNSRRRGLYKMHKLKYNKDPRETRLEDLPGPKSKEELDEMKMPYEEYCKAKFDPGNEFGKPSLSRASGG